MENGEDSLLVNPEKLDDDEEVLRFLDSVDTYLKLLDSVSSILRQVPLPPLDFIWITFPFLLILTQSRAPLGIL